MKRLGLLGIMLLACLCGCLRELRAQDTIRMTGVRTLYLDWRTAGKDVTLIADVGNARQTIRPRTQYEFDDTVRITLYCSTSFLDFSTCGGSGSEFLGLDVSGCHELEKLDCNSNFLASLDVSGCMSLTELVCYTNALTSLDVSGCMALTKLHCNSNRLTLLNVNGCTALSDLSCGDNALTSLEVSSLTALRHLNCAANALTSLDVSDCHELEYLYCSGNFLTSLNVSGCTALLYLHCYTNALTSLDVSGFTALRDLYCLGNRLTSLNVSGCTHLCVLHCYGNALMSLDVSGCAALREVTCGGNKMASLDASGCTALRELYCGTNALTSLDVSGCTALRDLYCFDNALTLLDVSDCTALYNLICYDNALTSLNVSGCTQLCNLSCYGNALTSLDVSGCTHLWSLYCSSNDLSVLDVSNNKELKSLDCRSCNLTSLFLDNNGSIGALAAEGNRRRAILDAKSHRFDLESLSGFEVERAYNWKGGKVVDGHYLEYDNVVVTYDYFVNLQTRQSEQFCLKVKSDNANLRWLQVASEEPYVWNRLYDLSFEIYTAVPYQCENVVVSAYTDYELAQVVSGLGEYHLEVGDNHIEIVVMAEDSSLQIYALTIRRVSADADLLQSLSVSAGTLEPTFTSEVYKYNVEVSYETDSLEVFAAARDENATVSGVGKYGLQVGDNHIEIVVTAEDGSHHAYTLTVTRHQRVLSSDATLRLLRVSSGTLAPAFSPTIFNYRVEVVNATQSIEVIAEANDDNASVSGGQRHNLAVGDNHIEIVVTAEDGTQQTYALVVYREKPKDPTAVESVSGRPDVQVYAQDGAIHLSKAIGELSVYTATGICVYSGQAVVIPVPQPGLYIVRSLSDGYSWKVVVR